MRFFTALNLRRDKKKLRETLARNPAFRALDKDTFQALTDMLAIPGHWEKREKYKRTIQGTEECNMCQTMRELLEDARNSGIQQGIGQGIQQSQLIIIRNMLSLGLPTEIICNVVECSPEYIEKVRGELPPVQPAQYDHSRSEGVQLTKHLKLPGSFQHLSEPNEIFMILKPHLSQLLYGL